MAQIHLEFGVVLASAQSQSSGRPENGLGRDPKLTLFPIGHESSADR